MIITLTELAQLSIVERREGGLEEGDLSWGQYQQVF